MFKAKLPSKPDAELSYSLHDIKGETESPATRFLVFLNNLAMPAASWNKCIELLKQQREASPMAKDLTVITYDRFGQGATTDRDPLDARPAQEPGYGHDFLDVVHDLHELIGVALTKRLPAGDQITKPELFLVGGSVGAPIARLYAETYPNSVSGILILDSNICNQEMKSLWPTAQDVKENPKLVEADDCTADQYLEQSVKLGAMFGLQVKNKESLDRRNGPKLLPYADKPKLSGPGGQTTKVIVVGHDPDTFEEESLKMMGTPKSLSHRFAQPPWDEYNNGLLEIGDPVGEKKVLIAKGCGHFIQKDGPGYVTEQMVRMLESLGW